MSNSTNITLGADSFYRPFGVLPVDSDTTFSIDKKYGLFTLAIGIGAVVCIHAFFLGIAIWKKWDKLANWAQKSNMLLAFLGEVSLLIGLVDIGMSSREYPFDEPLYAQILGFTCILAQTFLFLPSLFLKPVFQNGKLAKLSIVEMVILGVGLGLVAACVALEIAVVAKGVTGVLPKAVLYTLFALQLASVLAQLAFGIWSIMGADSKLPDPKLSVGKDQKRITLRLPLKGLRIAYLMAGVLGVLSYIVFHALESPNSLLMRGLEVVSLFIIILVDFFYTWSVVKTISSIEFANENSQSRYHDEIEPFHA